MKPPLGGLRRLGGLGASLHLLEVKGSRGRSRQSGAAVRAQGVFIARREPWRVRCMRIHTGWGMLSQVIGRRLARPVEENKQLQRVTFLDFPDGLCKPVLCAQQSVRSDVCPSGGTAWRAGRGSTWPPAHARLCGQAWARVALRTSTRLCKAKIGRAHV